MRTTAGGRLASDSAFLIQHSAFLQPMATHTHFGRSFQFFVHSDYEELSHWASRTILHRAAQKPDLILCAATGASPTRTYELIAGAWANRRNLAARLRIVKLDEWGGLAAD